MWVTGTLKKAVTRHAYPTIQPEERADQPQHARGRGQILALVAAPT
jgi:hypothetical protein